PGSEPWGAARASPPTQGGWPCWMSRIWRQKSGRGSWSRSSPSIGVAVQVPACVSVWKTTADVGSIGLIGIGSAPRSRSGALPARAPPRVPDTSVWRVDRGRRNPRVATGSPRPRASDRTLVVLENLSRDDNAQRRQREVGEAVGERDDAAREQGDGGDLAGPHRRVPGR